MTPPGTGHVPPAWMRRLLEACLPPDDWSREYLAELEFEHRRRTSGAAGNGRWTRRGAALWYARQCVSPDTVRFVRMMRARERAPRRAGGGTTTGGGGGGMGGFDGWIQDFRHAARILVREPRFTLFVALTLSLGIGGNAAMYGVADRILLRGPEHVMHPDELARLYLRTPGQDGLPARTAPWIPWLTARAIQQDGGAFRGVAIQRTVETLVAMEGETRPRALAVVDPAYFDVLGATPVAGTFFGGRSGAEGDVAVLSHAVWRATFAGRPGAIGSTIDVAGQNYTVVGIAPEGFTGVGLAPIDVWTPIDPATAGSRNWQVIGRLSADRADDDGRALAAAAADAIHHRTDPGRFFQWALDGTMVAEPIGFDDEARPPAEAAVARLLLAVAALVLLIACANVASLMLARLTRRRRELAVRLALGVGRARLARLLLSETLALAAVAGAASLPVAWGGALLFRRVLLPGVAWSASPLPWPVLAITALVTLGAGLLVALLPMRHVARADVSDGLRSTRGGDGRRRPRVHLGLATLQVAFSAALLLGAGLFVKSFRTMRVTDLGVDATEVVAITLRPLDERALRSPSAQEFDLYQRALDEVSGDPGVESATLTLGLPFLYNFGLSIAVPGHDSIPELPGGGPYLSGVSAGYFEAIGTAVVEGRGFTPAEVAGDEPVVVVSASMARLLWPTEGAIGQCVRVGDASQPCSTVIGVAEDVHRVGYREPASMQYYVPLAPGGGFGGTALVVRPRRMDGATLGRIRERLGALDPVVAYVDMTRLDTVLDGEVRPWRMGAWILGIAAGVALLVSLAGVYGVLSYLVEQRRREIGVRIALGASTTGIQGLIVRGGLGAATLGLAAGVGAAVAAAPWVQPLLFETSVFDPVVLGSTIGLLLSAATLACLIPARRAARVEPAVCLNEE